jgi:hypothetical protein
MLSLMRTVVKCKFLGKWYVVLRCVFAMLEATREQYVCTNNYRLRSRHRFIINELQVMLRQHNIFTSVSLCEPKFNPTYKIPWRTVGKELKQL